MIKLLFILGLISFTAQNLLAQQGIHKIIPKEYLNTFTPSVPLELQGYTMPPSFNVRTAAEWEEMRGLIISWDNDTYSDAVIQILAQIVDYAQEDAIVYIICKNQTHQGVIEDYLTNKNIPLTNVLFIYGNYQPILWTRDFGPISIYQNYTQNISLVDWLYYPQYPHFGDFVPQLVGDYINVDVYRTSTSPYILHNQGGNFMTDGHNTAFATHFVLDQNGGDNYEDEVDMTMQAFNGIQRFKILGSLPIALEEHVADHIDMYMKMLDEETILVGEYEAGVEGSNNNAQINSNIDSILNFPTCFNRIYDIERIPMPEITTTEKNGTTYTEQRTYTNSLIINNTVLVPVYGLDEDAEALSIYQNLMSGYNIFAINCEEMIYLSGAIHCITMGIGDNDPVFISHKKVRDEEVEDTGPYKVNALIDYPSGIAHAEFYWSNSATTGYQEVDMVNTDSKNYLAYVPPQAAGSTVYYYISGTSNYGKTIKKPFPGGSPNYGYYKFEVPSSAEPPYNLTLSNETVPSGITVEYQALNNITAGPSYLVESGADLTFTSGNSITLNPGFSTEVGCEFYANTNLSVGKSALMASSSSPEPMLEHDLVTREENFKNEAHETPAEYCLKGNYPNPFNPATTIKYALKEDRQVELYIYNMLGQRVKTLVNRFQSAGYKQVIWDGTNENGIKVPSGLYIYRINAGNFIAAKKMLLLK